MTGSEEAQLPTGTDIVAVLGTRFGRDAAQHLRRYLPGCGRTLPEDGTSNAALAVWEHLRGTGQL